MNEMITYSVLQAVVDMGVRKFVMCPGSRNSSFVEPLRIEERITTYYHPEERSAAFFAMGLSRSTNQPVAVVTTSGTAAGELLPSVMEAYYSGVPLIVITADRPRSFRGTGAPQSAEQVGLFTQYAKTFDISEDTPCDLAHWNKRCPIHINVCLEEPQGQKTFAGKTLRMENTKQRETHGNFQISRDLLDRFFSQVERPIAIVSTLYPEARETVLQLLLQLQIPVLLESISGLREDPRLEHLRIYRTDNIFTTSESCGYAIDGVLRIGGIPTHRVWRDLEYLREHVKVCAISENIFSGLSWTRAVACLSIPQFLKQYQPSRSYKKQYYQEWLENEKMYAKILQELFIEEPLAETSLLAALSERIPKKALVYLGNSLPIREWDISATREIPHSEVFANRGVNGIDGQLSTFLGLCRENSENWAILGDLTALYDMAGYWIAKEMPDTPFTVVIVNNGGGMIFKRMYKHIEMQNCHQLSFEHLAKMWGLRYVKCESKEHFSFSKGSCQQIVEIVPDPEATQRFWDKLSSRAQAMGLVIK